MTRYLISFPSGAMDHISDEEMPGVGEAAYAVVQEAMDAGAWVFGGGLAEDVQPVMVAGDGTTTAGTYPQTKEFNGGFTVLEVPSREAALEWAAKFAVACRCAQEVREFGPDREVANCAKPNSPLMPQAAEQTLAWASVLSADPASQVLALLRSQPQDTGLASVREVPRASLGRLGV